MTNDEYYHNNAILPNIKFIALRFQIYEYEIWFLFPHPLSVRYIFGGESFTMGTTKIVTGCFLNFICGI